MPKSSLQLIAECQQRGLLSKQAAAQVLEQREQLIKQAMAKYANRLFKALRSFRSPPPDKSAKAGKGLLEKFRFGGRTPAKMKDGVAEPVAGWSDVAANLGKMMALAGLTAGATAGIGGIMRHSKDKKLKAEIDTSYKNMFKEHPQLKDIQENDPGRVRRHFGVLARYAPSLAADPTVAGSWVAATAQLGQINTGDIKNLAETQRRIDETREDHGVMKMAPMKAGEFAAKAMMI
jgi:hypothetical protein